MYKLHCTKKLLERIKPCVESGVTSSVTALGSWYATAMFWRPQLALFVNEKTLLPVLMPLAPAATLAERFPEYLALVLDAHGVSPFFIRQEQMRMADAHFDKTVNRSVVGIMNQFAYLAEGYRDYHGTVDVLTLALKLAQTPCRPLYRSATSPDRELKKYLGELGYT